VVELAPDATHGGNVDRHRKRWTLGPIEHLWRGCRGGSGVAATTR
jgi:hypothetical protein